ncbi:FAD-dependent oxidoreductase [Brevibacterium daeguense]|uniref:FAD-dependent oxidoreductase n=1 Tax=Brevibacterium daeguense TaxID=909936 RepID=A0ABP8EFP8_9MICO|nr:FAD-dependent oxidoreductase [Brevibacterium daeguense]
MRNGEISHWMAEAPRSSVRPIPGAGGADGGADEAVSGLGPPGGASEAGADAAASRTGASVFDRSAPAPLPQEAQDLVIVGGGLTGLWLAYYAALEHPDWAITILEAKEVGYGASGRNGGWLSTLIPGNRAVYARAAEKAGEDGIAAVSAFQLALFTTIEDTLAVLRREGIDARHAQGGNLTVAQTRAGLERLRAAYDADLKYGYSPEDVRLLSAEETRARVNVSGALGGLFHEHTTAIDPARLTRGLARAVAARGVRICEVTRVSRIDPGMALTQRGPVQGRAIISCAEAYSGRIAGPVPGLGPRSLIPVNSAMIITEPLPDSTWEQIGWTERECLNDAAHGFIYAQRTADGRIAIGGRGAPYAFGSGTPGDGAVDPATITRLRQKLQSLFPGHDFPIAHSWRGVIGVTRDWCTGVHFDSRTRLGAVRGYAGHGVAATQLAARTLLDRIDGKSTVRTSLPWNDHDSGTWEPEPVRWLGVHGMYRLFGLADRWEESRGAEQTSLLARFGSRLAGMHE